MISAGTSYEDEFSRVTFLRTAADTDGAEHEQRVEYYPGSPFPPTHLHPAQDERFLIETGAMVFVVDGAEKVVHAGEEIAVPRRTAHRARNASDTEPAVVRWETRPALRTGEFFYRAHLLGGKAGVTHLALLAHEYRDVFRLTGATALLVPVIGRLALVTGSRLPRLDPPGAG
jgi:mannose-6-phosphate isomerase-like protein (cupin superfamily)